jgi:hypothetical protein
VRDAVDVIDGLERLGLQPVLVGGMALVLLGSQRVTQDFDFVISHPGDQIDHVVDLCYRRGLELVSKLNAAGEVLATIDNRKVAATRLRLDAPASAFFFNAKTFVRIDLLFDFPVAAATLRANSVATKIRSRTVHVAATADLLRLKEIAAAKRSFSGDAQDIAFLKAHLQG